jgi:hypothetical protein
MQSRKKTVALSGTNSTFSTLTSISSKRVSSLAVESERSDSVPDPGEKRLRPSADLLAQSSASSLSSIAPGSLKRLHSQSDDLFESDSNSTLEAPPSPPTETDLDANPTAQPLAPQRTPRKKARTRRPRQKKLANTRDASASSSTTELDTLPSSTHVRSGRSSSKLDKSKGAKSSSSSQSSQNTSQQSIEPSDTASASQPNHSESASAPWKATSNQ